MATITFKGNPVSTSGELPAAGALLPDFRLVRGNLSEATLEDFKGKRLVLNIFPSLDTPVCAASVRRFNQDAAAIGDTTVLCISADLPFAHNRFCTTEGIEKLVLLSTFRSPEFGEDYGVTMTDGPLKGLLARAVVVADAEGRVIYTELVPEIAQEPDYAKALDALGH